jgi:hypothetical protein
LSTMDIYAYVTISLWCVSNQMMKPIEESLTPCSWDLGPYSSDLSSMYLALNFWNLKCAIEETVYCLLCRNTSLFDRDLNHKPILKKHTKMEETIVYFQTIPPGIKDESHIKHNGVSECKIHLSNFY